MIKQRLITAVILIAVIALLLFDLPSVYWLAFTVLMTTVAAWEWYGLLKTPPRPKWISFAYAIIMGLIAFCAMHYLDHIALYGATILMTLWGFIAIWRYSATQSTHQAGLHDPVLAVFLCLWLLAPFLTAMNDLMLAPKGVWVILLAMSVIWVNDSMAYTTGRLFGKTPLIPAVSPNKTWEGLLGGLVSATVWGNLAGHFLWPDMLYPWSFALLIILLTVSANIGDLLISLLKRLANKKDCSNLLPGHGGVLDRIDSLLTGIPLFALGCTLLGLISH